MSVELGAEKEAERLAELLCARLCHDLAGAVGAVAAGAELVAEEGTAGPMAAEALELMAVSAASLAARLSYLRLALGPANQGAVAQARGLAEAYFAKGHPQGEWRLDWPPNEAAPVSPDQAKLLLNLICLAQECLPRGGVIAVRPAEIEMVIARGSPLLGEAAQWLRPLLSDGMSPRAAQGAYAALLARRLSCRIDLRKGDDVIAFAVERQIVP